MSSSPEVKKRTEMRKIESELKTLPSQILKNGFLQPNFAELFRILYENTKPIDDILSSTITSDDIHRNGRFEYELIITGFNSETQEKINSLSFESRKKEALNEQDVNLSKLIEKQKRTMEAILKMLNSPTFIRIDDTLTKLKQLADICHFNYLNIIREFAPNFDGFTNNSFETVSSCSPDKIVNYLMDLCYITGGFNIDLSESRAICALKQIETGKALSATEQDKISGHLRKINSIFTKYLTQDVLKKIICLGKGETSVQFQAATYRSNSLKGFTEFFQSKFNSDSERIKGEIKDYTVSFEIKELFGDRPLEELQYYNSETNEFLRKNTPYSFIWITPMQVLKSFMTVFMTSAVKTVINNIVIEGFFNNSAYKSEFSSVVYAMNEIENVNAGFEKSFDRGEPNDDAELRGLVRDSRKDQDFLKKVGSMVDSINNQAHKIIQEQSKILYQMYIQIGELIVDAKKSKSDVISNIKVLLNSTRNRDGSSAIDQQHESWKMFLKIMKNYAILGELEKDE
ncbi:hypothetical protein [Treponema sp.]|uniref:hypothetical protein n=1 Tax=Treponema sp. TaxID=166 RepID=UPI00388FD3A4